MAEKEGASKVSLPSRPTINLPPRASMETLFAGGPGFSPGPMTLVSNFFSDNYSDSGSCSFSQLLAGAMNSPVAAIAGVKPSFLVSNSTDKDLKSRDGSEKNLGFKQNRPMNLVVAQSPMFMIPSGLSPSGLLNSPGLFSPLQSPFGMSHQQALAHVTAQAAFSQSYMLTPDEYKPPSIAVSTESLTHYPSFDSNMDLQNKIHTVLSEPESSNMESAEVPHSDSKSVPPSHPIDKPANDGYNWRKYGQKQVKASDHPRSYYKCTHSNCPVKKKVEHNLDGQIAEITYKGQHNHELPQPTKRARDGSDVNGSTSSQTRPELGSQGQMVSGSNEIVHSHPVYGSDQVVKMQQTHAQFPGSSDYGEMGDAEIRLDEGDGDEPNPKRRETEGGASEVASSQKTVSEARIIVQTRSEVDLLDDGYKWRKYGQKVVKGNPHPRSYYKCTYTGCNVRKHVERASTDPKAVITTYEGKHNHDLPAGRNSNAMQVKPQKVVARKPALLKDMDFANKDQMPVLLQLKEEQIIA